MFLALKWMIEVTANTNPRANSLQRREGSVNNAQRKLHLNWVMKDKDEWESTRQTREQRTLEVERPPHLRPGPRQGGRRSHSSVGWTAEPATLYC